MILLFFINVRNISIQEEVCFSNANLPLILDDNAIKFLQAGKNGILIPLYRCIFSDHQIPVLAYWPLPCQWWWSRCSNLCIWILWAGVMCIKCCKLRSLQPRFFINHLIYIFVCRGKFSTIGAHPTMEIVAEENLVTVMDHRKWRKTEDLIGDPMVFQGKSWEAGARGWLMSFLWSFLV